MNNNSIINVPLEKIVHNRFQQEGVKDEAKVLEIVASLKQNENNGTKGLLQVPTARKNADGNVELAFGHHRFYAFDYLKNIQGDLFFGEMPLIIRDLTDIEMFELMAIENFHRRDIGPIEEANTLNSYMVTFNKTSVEAAQKFEKTEEYIRGSIRLLNLPESAQKMVSEGKLNKSAARDLLVVEKLGGSDLVQEALDEIASSPDGESPSTVIVDVLRMSNKAQFLDKDAAWFSSKKFPVKHLRGLSHTDLSQLVKFEEGYSVGEPINLIKEIFILINSGMEVVNEAFPMIAPDGLERVHVLANPPQCEKCPFHAVMDGMHFCGLPLCKTRKIEAWKNKQVEDEIKKTGIPLYQKSDGRFAELFWRNDTDQKLFKNRGADLRLLPAQYQWNNFDGISQEFKVVLVGDAAEKRLKKEEAEGKHEVEKQSNVQKEMRVRELKQEFLARFEWEVVSRAFESILDGVTSLSFLIFNRIEMIEWHANDTQFPEGVNEEKLIADAQNAKAADGLKTMRRINMFHAVERAHTNDYEFNKVLNAKKPVVMYAGDFELIAKEWGVKLPKDFSKQAEQYQAELNAAIKELGK